MSENVIISFDIMSKGMLASFVVSGILIILTVTISKLIKKGSN